MCRFGVTEFVKKVKPSPKKYPDFEAYRYKISQDVLSGSKVLPGNKIYWQNVIDGAVNLTSIQQAPVFLTRLFYSGTEDRISSKVIMQDQQGNIPVYNADTDDVFLDLEPTTGVPTKINFDLMTSVGLQSDTLISDFPKITKDDPMLIPVFILRRNMSGLSEKQIDDIFGQLMTGNSAISYLRIFLVVLSVGLLFLVIYISMKNKDLQEVKRDDLIEPEDDNDVYVSARIIDGEDIEEEKENIFDKDQPFESKVTAQVDEDDDLKDDVDQF